MKDSKENKNKRIVKVFLDDEEKPFAAFNPPVRFTLDTTKIPDGKHELKVVANSSQNIEGVRIIPFEVKNGPKISVIGLKDNETIDTETPITVNAYGSENPDKFIIAGSEDPKAIPAWLWALLIIIIAFGMFYIILYWDSDFYKSFF